MMKLYNIFNSSMLLITLYLFEISNDKTAVDLIPLQVVAFAANGFFSIGFLLVCFRHAKQLTPRYGESLPNGLINTLAIFFGCI
jgi:hypothetical protein